MAAIGTNRLLAKPFRIDELLGVIHDLGLVPAGIGAEAEAQVD
jgi:hypothetical protein